MIRVINDYAIDVSDKCYVVGKVAKVKKDGGVVEVITNPAYFTTFEGCLEWVYKRLRMEALKNIDCDLATALEVIRAADTHMRMTLDKLGFKIVKKEFWS